MTRLYFSISDNNQGPVLCEDIEINVEVLSTPVRLPTRVLYTYYCNVLASICPDITWYFNEKVIFFFCFTFTINVRDVCGIATSSLSSSKKLIYICNNKLLGNEIILTCHFSGSPSNIQSNFLN